jgi:hypothetical protein
MLDVLSTQPDGFTQAALTRPGPFGWVPFRVSRRARELRNGAAR